jgi:hypothetical protein
MSLVSVDGGFPAPDNRLENVTAQNSIEHGDQFVEQPYRVETLPG